MNLSPSEQKIVHTLQSNWIWPPTWTDSPPPDTNTAGRIVRFTRPFSLPSPPKEAILHISADTRYKIRVNGVRVAVGPARGSPTPALWYFDTLDVAGYLRQGENEIRVDVLRYFAGVRGAMPFSRTALPGFTLVGSVYTETGDATKVDLDTGKGGWLAQVDEGVAFPMGRVDDVFLHINECVSPTALAAPATPVAYGIKTLNGELAPWRLRPRPIPMYEESHVAVDTVRSCHSTISPADWTAWLAQTTQALILPAGSSHAVVLQADVHSTAFIRWTFSAAAASSSLRMKITYSEGFEAEPRAYPFFRTKGDRLDAMNGHLIGPFDDVELDIPAGEAVTYEPFWFRTFRLLRLEVAVGAAPVTLTSFEATQVNYPLAVKATWENASDPESAAIWAVSIRTLRNCMFDAYSDCPFYEQLQYSGDSRSVALFHYLLSGDDRLMRQAITAFAASTTAEGLTQSRFPSHVPQIIPAFSLYWVLQVCDHHLFFGDAGFARSFIPRIDGVLEFFDAHVDNLGLVSGLPEEVWQYVDWVATWGATDSHADKGVPTAGRKSNRHTFFSLLYAYVLQQAAQLVRDVGRPGNAGEYESRAAALQRAVRAHCYEGRFFTDSTVDAAVGDENGSGSAYSQHCQVFAVISGTAEPGDRARLIRESLSSRTFSKCSYMMRFYLLRAASIAGDTVYESLWREAWVPYRKMLAQNLTTWEEDDVRQRSDCHAWGSVPIYEFCVELAGVRPVAAGAKRILFMPRLRLSDGIKARVALGRDNVAAVEWRTEPGGEKRVELRLERAVEVVSRLPGGEEVEHGVVCHLLLVWGQA
ncbi:putative rhamnosidase B [Aspergillus lucknowensis]|uniref:Six-hairpin glycosidase-like protein n=1 Tax=Aspergillus lucknowensis TaxID=176173 RepID=A0ABR4LT90_9EURO